MKKLKKRILEIAILLTVVFSTLPFFCHNVYADTLSSLNVIGINVWSERLGTDTQQVNNNTIWRNYVDVHIQFELDDAYIGWQNMGVVVNYKNYYYGSQNPSWGNTSVSWSGNYYINGSSFEIIVPISFYSNSSAYYQNGSALPNSDSFITVSYTTQGNISTMASLQSLDDIISILDDIQHNISVDIHDDLNDLLKKLSKQNIEVDSFNAWSFFFNYNWFDRDYQDPLATYWYQLQDPDFFNLPYPFIKVGVGENTTTGMVQLQPNLRLYPYGTDGQPHEYIYIGWFASRMQINTSNWSTYFYSNNSDKFDIEADRLIASVSYYLDGTPTYLSLWKFRMKPNFTSGNYTAGMRMHGIWNDSITYGYISPVYSGSDLVEGATGIDFALRYGLKNPLLTNLEIIAKGTSSSNSSASDLQEQTSDINDITDQMFQLEDSFNDDLQDNLQQINTNFDVGNQFGSKFLYSANWVRTQFNNLTYLNPFGSLLSFSLLLGIGLLIIGKVLG